jgi:hypothetical protein
MNKIEDVPFSLVEFNKKIIFIIWLLVFSKCSILEYYIQKFQLPINSGFYIWTLSISLATLVSLLFWNHIKPLAENRPESIKIRYIINLALLTLFTGLNGTSLLLSYWSVSSIISINVLLLGIYLTTNGLLQNRKIQTITGTITFALVYPVYQSNIPGVYLLLSVALVLMSVPYIIDLILYRKKAKA